MVWFCSGIGKKGGPSFLTLLFIIIGVCNGFLVILIVLVSFVVMVFVMVVVLFVVMLVLTIVMVVVVKVLFYRKTGNYVYNLRCPHVAVSEFPFVRPCQVPA